MSVENSIPIGQQALNYAQAGGMRLPCLMVTAAGAIAVAEIALRILNLVTFSIFSAPGNKINEWCNDNVPGYERIPFRVFKETPVANLILSAIVLNVVGNVGNDLVHHTMGKAPKIYNNFLENLGPIRVSSTPYFTPTTPLVGRVVQYFKA